MSQTLEKALGGDTNRYYILFFTIFVRYPVHDVLQAIRTNVLVGASHDQNLSLANLFHGARGLLLDAVLGLVVVVVRSAGHGSVVGVPVANTYQ